LSDDADGALITAVISKAQLRGDCIALKCELPPSRVDDVLWRLGGTPFMTIKIGRNGKPWTHRQVAAILARRESYQGGIVRYGDVTGYNSTLNLFR